MQFTTLRTSTPIRATLSLSTHRSIPSVRRPVRAHTHAHWNVVFFLSHPSGLRAILFDPKHQSLEALAPCLTHSAVTRVTSPVRELLFHLCIPVPHFHVPPLVQEMVDCHLLFFPCSYTRLPSIPAHRVCIFTFIDYLSSVTLRL